jgi:hypothetical protein
MSERIKFLADMNFKLPMLHALIRVQPSVEFYRSGDQGINLHGMPDPEVLALAAQLHCILLTHDVQTMPHHFGAFLAEGNTSYGVIMIPQLAPIGQVIEPLLLIWEGSTAEEWINQIDRIPWK